ncbi:hypothetical protein CI109_106635 [Kwoniella shandongensis]|uniref:Uncharacterized protein n=1 Tax=Kwoniella shandongensis TaxID=1734106 RepID=A0A5M6BTW1_9TREE|nr:uncharacterized protein CI109_007199 [Kwoniella shandongensis]KAA5524449.1 hypothetical protein CI109_007199 [Kwoniella shandongensis]
MMKKKDKKRRLRHRSSTPSSLPDASDSTIQPDVSIEDQVTLERDGGVERASVRLTHDEEEVVNLNESGNGTNTTDDKLTASASIVSTLRRRFLSADHDPSISTFVTPTTSSGKLQETHQAVRATIDPQPPVESTTDIAPVANQRSHSRPPTSNGPLSNKSDNPPLAAGGSGSIPPSRIFAHLDLPPPPNRASFPSIPNYDMQFARQPQFQFRASLPPPPTISDDPISSYPLPSSSSSQSLMEYPYIPHSTYFRQPNSFEIHAQAIADQAKSAKRVRADRSHSRPSIRTTLPLPPAHTHIHTHQTTEGPPYPDRTWADGRSNPTSPPAPLPPSSRTLPSISNFNPQVLASRYHPNTSLSPSLSSSAAPMTREDTTYSYGWYDQPSGAGSGSEGGPSNGYTFPTAPAPVTAQREKSGWASGSMPSALHGYDHPSAWGARSLGERGQSGSGSGNGNSRIHPQYPQPLPLPHPHSQPPIFHPRPVSVSMMRSTSTDDTSTSTATGTATFPYMSYRPGQYQIPSPFTAGVPPLKPNTTHNHDESNVFRYYPPPPSTPRPPITPDTSTHVEPPQASAPAPCPIAVYVLAKRRQYHDEGGDEGTTTILEGNQRRIKPELKAVIAEHVVNKGCENADLVEMVKVTGLTRRQIRAQLDDNRNNIKKYLMNAVKDMLGSNLTSDMISNTNEEVGS